MKEQGVTKTALILLVLVCVFAIVACSDNVNTKGNACKHTLNDDGKCTICKQQIVGTEGVVYVSYVIYAAVTGYIGTESNVKIAAFYEDLPVIRIDDSAFSDCASLESVTISDNVTSIGNSAFNNSTSLTSVTIPDSVTSIGNGAFRDCMSLTSITIPDSVTSIGNQAFLYCTSLTSVTIGNSVTSIGDWAFYNCTSLTSVTIPDRVTDINYRAFYGCTSLTSVTIGDGVKSIGELAINSERDFRKTQQKISNNIENSLQMIA